MVGGVIYRDWKEMERGSKETSSVLHMNLLWMSIRYMVSENVEHIIRKIILYYRDETRARCNFRGI